MEELASYYSELNLLQLKYEHLLEISRTLLRPWPDASGEEVHNNPSKAESTLSSPKKENSKPPHHEDLEQLEALLSKAQKLRIQAKPDEEKITKKSMRAASSVYNAASQGDRPAKVKTTHNPRGCRNDSKSHKPGAAKLRTKQTSLSTLSKLHPQDHSMAPSKENEASCNPPHKETEGFSLVKKGTQLSLPSKYNKLKSLVTKCEEALAEEDTLIASKAAATHYSKRLLAKESANTSDHRHICLLLAGDKLNLLKEKLALIAPKEWTVSERSSWQDVLLVKTKVDMLIHTYDAAIAGLGLKATPTQSILLEHRGAGEPPSCCTTTTREFGYSSLRDWNMLTQLLLQRQFREWEERFLGEIRDVLLPLAARAVASCSRASRHQEPLHSAVSALQAIHVAVGLRTYPAFLNTEHLTEE